MDDRPHLLFRRFSLLLPSAHPFVLSSTRSTKDQRHRKAISDSERNNQADKEEAESERGSGGGQVGKDHNIWGREAEAFGAICQWLFDFCAFSFRIDITSPIVVGANGKHSAPNGSQTDSGVFTLGSTSAAAAANAVAANGLNGGKMGGILLGRKCVASLAHSNSLLNFSISPSGDGEWVDGTVPSSPPQQQHQLEPYDFSNDPFLQEFAAANALGGIVVVENALHQSSSTESSPSIGQQGQQGKPPNPYTK